MPESMKDKYQYITKADITSLKELGYKKNFFSLEEGVHDYINNHPGVRFCTFEEIAKDFKKRSPRKLSRSKKR